MMFDKVENGIHSPFCTNPDTRKICVCGENESCRTCGWGKGSYPCTCTKARMQEDRQFPIKHCKSCTCATYDYRSSLAPASK